jgi:LysM repeat protein
MTAAMRMPGRAHVRFLILPLVMILMMLIFTPGAQAEESSADSHGSYYTVQPGDTLYSIATRYGSTVYAISVANNIVNPNLIYAGSLLWIPTAVPAQPIEPPAQPDPSCRYYHTVTWGDTMLRLGQYYSVSPWAIGQANGIYNLNIIYRGQTLCIP